MEVVIQPDAYAAAELTARIIARRLQTKPNLALGLATGRTMEGVDWPGVSPDVMEPKIRDRRRCSRCEARNSTAYMYTPSVS